MRQWLWGATLIILGCSASRGVPCDYTDAGWQQGGWDAAFNLGWDGGPPDDAGFVTTSAIRPTFSSTEIASQPPPPVSGGTLIVTRDGRYAIAADPDRDRVYGVDLTTHLVSYAVALQPGDEPGRLVEDGAGRIHVALRSGGALVDFDETNGGSVVRRSVCPAPRGIAWDKSLDAVWVACATGELVAVPSSGGAAVRSFVVERDLRDVLIEPDGLAVSELRSAQVLRVDPATGTIVRRDLTSSQKNRLPHVAWRTVSGAGGQVIVVHQQELTSDIPVGHPNAYGGCGLFDPPVPPSNAPVEAGVPACKPDFCTNFSSVGCDEQPGAVVSALTVFNPDGTTMTSRVFPGALPVDVAVSPNGMAVVAAGDALTTTVGNVMWFTPCGDFNHEPLVLMNDTLGPAEKLHAATSAQPIALAFDATGELLVQTRDPAELVVIDSVTRTPRTHIVLSTVSRRDSGHEIFHTQAGAMVACASCHPEGGDDGHVWSLNGDARRTPSLRGTIAGTSPYHWQGTEPSLAALVDDVYTTRMNGSELSAAQKNALAGWVQKIPAPPAPSWVDGASAQRGQQRFNDPAVGCSGCHAGPKLTNNQTVDVGTGAAFQVPPLVGVGWRTPLLHDGCATTLADRFGKCATSSHGNTANLSTADITDLVSYLESL